LGGYWGLVQGKERPAEKKKKKFKEWSSGDATVNRRGGAAQLGLHKTEVGGRPAQEGEA